MTPSTSSADADLNSACPRCRQPFRCGVSDATPCTCSTLQLSDELRARLAARYDSCLCIACLVELSTMAPPAIDPPAP
ncbi:MULTISPECIES: cysteine-rich CWC family protein [unclassified Rhizobacter]|uniref:cysteine-rich CWC family protein n=1 Tax=unclassified Rhizobacter TaxID=2640088 RepID=UPI0006F22262|nr:MULTISPECIES: cysteine-rich CWC family protein [unclassified Rhizobacter]KQU74987.1 hypothetical protein ASC88_26610 [Rhizobacter sp. Root29]KQW00938.1 hypothetical protein ASC98_06355 [Rhizobacter sp. Root1238]KRB03788.1 hypothetical protein ASE08_13860 [Rhizobacter sp. Root16D2]